MAEHKVLLIEDDEDIRFLMERRLERRGYQIVTASDGEEGLQKARADNPDLIICDVMMPVKNGFQVCKELRAEGKQMPFIFLTAKSLSEDQAAGYRNGADDYILKPFDPMVLEAKIGSLLKRAKSA